MSAWLRTVLQYPLAEMSKRYKSNRFTSFHPLETININLMTIGVKHPSLLSLFRFSGLLFEANP